jgi:hypothetical protein
MSDAAITAQQVRAFLEEYASAFQRLDKDAVADRYAYPAHVVTYDVGVRLVSVPTREMWTAVVERILQMYGAMGVRRAAMRDLRVTNVLAQAAQAQLVWALFGTWHRRDHQRMRGGTQRASSEAAHPDDPTKGTALTGAGLAGARPPT